MSFRVLGATRDRWREGNGASYRLYLDTPRDVSFFSKLIQREIIYRLLQGSLGARLRAIATFETKCHRTAKAVAWLRSNYEKPLRVEHLATIAGMSRSTLHHHFRALTAMSPLQFQKQLRLHAARQRMLTSEVDAASAAFEVGYESPSQFNREYRRFLASPQFAISRPCETAKSWRSLPLNAELLGCHGAACSRLSQTGPYAFISERLKHIRWEGVIGPMTLGKEWLGNNIWALWEFLRMPRLRRTSLTLLALLLGQQRRVLWEMRMKKSRSATISECPLLPESKRVSAYFTVTLTAVVVVVAPLVPVTATI